MMPTFPGLAGLAVLMAGAPGPAQAQYPPIVRTEAGLTQGAAPDASGVAAFKGIPYAAPPVGELRWRNPQPAPRWDGVHQAARFGSACWQAPVPGRSPAASPPQSEDCLTLNVWTPAANGRAGRPVMVWLHGGGFQFGSSAQPVYDGARLAARGVVVVSLNYRLGAFGFLAHPALDREAPGSGAFGLQDQLAALRWVERNIGEFGGDAGNVTLFGESAGAHSVGILLASPLARGLFDKAIVQSGAFWDSEHGSIISHETALQQGLALSARAEAPTAADLRAIPADRLNTLTAYDFVSDPALTAFAPSIDGRLLRESPATALRRGRLRNIPLLGGWNDAEFALFTSRALPHATAKEFNAAAAKLFGADRMAEFTMLYPSHTPQELAASSNTLIGDLVISEQTWRLLGLHAQAHDARTFAYQFSYTSPYSPIAAHTADLPFVFGTLTPQTFAPTASAASANDRHLSDVMMSYWTNFATHGDPNGPGLPFWPAYAGSGSTVMRLQANPAAGAETGTDRLRFIASFQRDGRFPEAWRTSVRD